MEENEIGDVDLSTYRTQMTPARPVVASRHARSARDPSGVVKICPLIVILLVNNVLAGVCFVAIFNWWYKDQYQVHATGDGSFRASGTINTVGLQVEDEGDLELGIKSVNGDAMLRLDSKRSSLVLDSHFTEGSLEFKSNNDPLAAIQTDQAGNLKVKSESGSMQVKATSIILQSEDVHGEMADVNVYGKLLVDGDTELDGTTVILGSTSLEGDLDIVGDVSLAGANTVVESLNASGLVTLRDGLTVLGETHLKGLDVENGTVVLHQGLAVTGGNTAVESLRTTAQVIFDGGLTVSAAPGSPAPALTIAQALFSAGDLVTTGDADFQSNLTITGHSTVQAVQVQGQFIAHGSVNVTGTTSVQALRAEGPVEALSGLTVLGGDTVADDVVVNGTFSANGGLNVTGSASVATFQSTGRLTVRESLAVSGHTDASRLTVDGPAELNGTLSVTGGLGVQTATVGGLLDVQGDAVVTGRSELELLTASGPVAALGDLQVAGQSTLVDLSVAGLSRLGGDLEVQGDARVDDLDAAGPASVLSNVTVAGTASVAALEVAGPSQLQNLTVQGSTATTTLTTHGKLTVHGSGGGGAKLAEAEALRVEGDAQLNTLTAQGLVTLAGGLTVSAGTTSVEDVQAAGPVVVQGAAVVSGHTSFRTFQSAGVLHARGGLDVAGELSVDELTASQRITLQSPLSVSGHAAVDDLRVAGATVLEGGLNVTGLTTVDELDVTGGFDARGDLTVAAGETLADRLVTSGPLRVLGDLAVDGDSLLQNVTARDAAEVQGGLAVVGHTRAEFVETSGELHAQSTLQATGGALVDALVASGDVALQGTLEVQGHARLDDARVDGLLTLHTELNVTGSTQADTVVASGLVTVGQDLEVLGSTLLAGGAMLDGPLTAHAGLTVAQGLTADVLAASGAVVVSSASGLNVTGGGVTTLHDDLVVHGATAVAGNLTVQGTASLQSLAVAGPLELGAGATVLGLATTHGPLAAEGLVEARAGLRVNGSTTVQALRAAKGMAALAGLNVTGLASLDALTVLGAAEFAGGLNVTGTTTLAASLQVDGPARLAGALDVVGLLTVQALAAAQPLTAQQDFAVLGNTTVRTDLVAAGGPLVAADGLVVDGTARVDTLTVAGAADLVGQLAVAGAAQLATANASGAVDFQAGLAVGGLAEVDALQVDGLLDAQAGLAVLGTTTVESIAASGAVSVAGTLATSGPSEFDSVLANAAVTVQGDVDVSGAATVNELYAAQPVDVAGALRVEGGASLLDDAFLAGALQVGPGGLAVSGTTAVDDLAASAAVHVGAGGLAVAGHTDVDTLAVAGTAVLQGDLTVTGAAAVQALTASGLVDAQGGLTVAGALAAERVRLHGPLDAQAGLTVAGDATLANLACDTDLVVAQDLAVVQGASLADLRVTGETQLAAGLTVSGRTAVANALNATQQVAALSGLNVSSTALVDDVVASGPVTALAGASVAGTSAVLDLVVVANASVAGTLTVSGDALLGSVEAQAPVQVDGGLTVLGAATLASLETNGLLTAHADLAVAGHLQAEAVSASGLVRAQSTLAVLGHTDAASVEASGLVLANAGLNVTGTTVLERLVASELVRAEAGLVVTGHTVVDTLLASGPLDCSATLAVAGATTAESVNASGLVTALAGADVQGASSVVQALAVSGLASFLDALTVEGTTALAQGPLVAKGAVDAQGGLQATGAATVAALAVDGLLTANGGFNVTGATALDALVANAAFRAEAGLAVAGSTTVQGVAASGKVALEAGVSVAGATFVQALTASGAVSAQDDLTVEGTATLASLAVLGDIDAQANLTVAGATTASQVTASGLVTARAGLQVGAGDTVVETLQAAGLVTANSGLTVTAGTTYLDTLALAGDLAVLGDTHVAGVFYADGDITTSGGPLAVTAASFLTLTSDAGATAADGTDASDITVQTQAGGAPSGPSDAGFDGGSVYLTAGDGSAASGGEQDGGDGGSIIFDAGAGGAAAGFGDAGTDGIIDLRVASVSKLEVAADAVSVKSASGDAASLTLVSNGDSGQTNFVLGADGASREFTITSTDTTNAFFRVDANDDLHIGSPNHNVVIEQLRNLGVSSTTGLEITNADAAPATATGTISVDPGQVVVTGATTRFQRDIEIGYRILIEQDWKIYVTQDISFASATNSLAHGTAGFFTDLISVNDVALVLAPVVSTVRVKFVRNDPTITIQGGTDVEWSHYVIPGYRAHFLKPSCLGLSGTLPSSCLVFQGTIVSVDSSTSVSTFTFEIDNAPTRNSFSGGDALKIEVPRTIVDVSTDGTTLQLSSGFDASVFDVDSEKRALSRVLVGRRVVSIDSDTQLTLESPFTELANGEVSSEDFYVQRHFLKATDFTGATAFAWDATGRLGIGTGYPNADIHVLQHSAAMLLDAFEGQDATLRLESGSFGATVAVNGTGDFTLSTDAQDTANGGDIVLAAGNSTGGDWGAVRIRAGGQEVLKVSTQEVRIGPPLAAKSITSGVTGKAFDISTVDNDAGDAGDINLVAGTANDGTGGQVVFKAGSTSVLEADGDAVTVLTDLQVNGTIDQVGAPGTDLLVSTPHSFTGDARDLVLEAGNAATFPEGTVVLAVGGEVQMTVAADAVRVFKPLYVDSDIVQGGAVGSDLTIRTLDATAPGMDAGDILLTAGQSASASDGQIIVNAGDSDVLLVSGSAVTVTETLAVAASIYEGTVGADLQISTPAVPSNSAGDLVLEAGTGGSADGEVVFRSGGGGGGGSGTDVLTVRASEVEITEVVVLQGDVVSGASSGSDLTFFTPDVASGSAADVVLRAGAGAPANGEVLLQAGAATVARVSEDRTTVYEKLVVDGQISPTAAGQSLTLRTSAGSGADVWLAAARAVQVSAESQSVATVLADRVVVHKDLEVLSAVQSQSAGDLTLRNSKGAVDFDAQTRVSLAVGGAPALDLTADLVVVHKDLVVSGSIVQNDDGSDLLVSTPDNPAGDAGDIVLHAATAPGASVRLRADHEDRLVVSDGSVEVFAELRVASSIVQGREGADLTLSTAPAPAPAPSAGDIVVATGRASGGGGGELPGAVRFRAGGAEVARVDGAGFTVDGELTVDGTIVQGGPAGTPLVFSTADSASGGTPAGDVVLAAGVATPPGAGSDGAVRFFAGGSEVLAVLGDAVQALQELRANGSVVYGGSAGSDFVLETPDTPSGVPALDVRVSAGTSSGGVDGTVALAAGGADALTVATDGVYVAVPLEVGSNVVQGGAAGSSLTISTPDALGAGESAGDVRVVAGQATGGGGGADGEVRLNVGGQDVVVVAAAQVTLNEDLTVWGAIEQGGSAGDDLVLSTPDCAGDCGDVLLTAGVSSGGGGPDASVVIAAGGVDVVTVAPTSVTVATDALVTSAITKATRGDDLVLSTPDVASGSAGDVVLAAGDSGAGADGAVHVRAGGQTVVSAGAALVSVSQVVELSDDSGGEAPLVFTQAAQPGAAIELRFADAVSGTTQIGIPARDGTLAVSAVAPLTLDAVTGDLALTIGSGLRIQGGVLDLNTSAIQDVGELAAGSIGPGFGEIDVGLDPISSGRATLRSQQPLVMEGGTGSVTFTMATVPTTTSTVTVPVDADGTMVVSASAPLSLDGATGQLALELVPGGGLQIAAGGLALKFDDIVEVGTLVAGEITPGFGDVDIGASTLSAASLELRGTSSVLVLEDGAGGGGGGSIALSLAQEPVAVTTLSVPVQSGTAAVAATAPLTLGAASGVVGLDLLPSGGFVVDGSGALRVEGTHITEVGTLVSGSIGPTFGKIDIGTSTLEAGVTTLLGLSPVVLDGSVDGMGTATLKLQQEPAVDATLVLPAVASGTLAVSAAHPLTLDAVSGDVGLAVGQGLALNVAGELAIDFATIESLGAVGSGSIQDGFGPIDIADSPLTAASLSLRGLAPLKLEGAVVDGTNVVTFALTSAPTAATVISLPAADGVLTVAASDPIALDAGSGNLELLVGSGLLVDQGALAVDFGSITEVGALTAGSITSTFGDIDIGTSPLTAGVTTLVGSSPLVLEGPTAGSGSVAFQLAGEPSVRKVLSVPVGGGTLAVSASAPLSLDAGTVQLLLGSGLQVGAGGALEVNFGDVAEVGTLAQGSIGPGFGPIDIGESTLRAGSVTLTAMDALVLEGAVGGDGNQVTLQLASDPASASTLGLPGTGGTLVVSASDPFLLDPATGEVQLKVGSGLSTAGGVLAVDFASITEVGALSAGSIVPGFGAIDIGVGTLAAGQATLRGTTPLVLEGDQATDAGKVSLSLAAGPATDVVLKVPSQAGTLVVGAQQPLQLDAVTGVVSLAVGGGLAVDGSGNLGVDKGSITETGELTSGSIAPTFGPIDIGSSPLEAGTTTLLGASPIVLEGATAGDGNRVTLTLASEPTTVHTIKVPAASGDGVAALGVQQPLTLDSVTGEVGIALGSGLVDNGGVLDFDTSTITEVGALSAGSITAGFGEIDIGTGALAAGQLTLSGLAPLVLEGATEGSGSVTLQLAAEPAVASTITVPASASASGTLAVAAASPLSLDGLSGTVSLAIGAGLADVGGELRVDGAAIDTVGTLTAGSIGAGFGDVDIGASPLSAGVATLGGAAPIVFEGSGGSLTLAVADPAATNTLKLPNADGTLAVSATAPLSRHATTGHLSLAVGAGLTTAASVLALDLAAITDVGALGAGSISSTFGPIDIGTSALQAATITLVGAQPLVLEGSGGGGQVAFELVGDPAGATTITVPVAGGGGTLAVGATAPLSLDAGTGALSLVVGAGLDVVGGELVYDAGLTSVGALAAGSIAPGFGAIDIGTSALTAGSLVLGGLAPVVFAGDAGGGSVSLVLAADPSGGDVLLDLPPTSGTLAVNAAEPLALDTATGTVSLSVGSGLSTAGNVLEVDYAGITEVGTLTSGSISSTFGAIDIGTGSLEAGVVTLADLTPIVFEDSGGSGGRLSLALSGDPSAASVLSLPEAGGTLAVAVQQPLTLTALGGVAGLSYGNGLHVDVGGNLAVDGSAIDAVGTLTSGSIAPGFGDVDIGASTLEAGVTTLLGLSPLVLRDTSAQVTFALAAEPAAATTITLPLTAGGTLAVSVSAPLTLGASSGVVGLDRGAGIAASGPLAVDAAAIDTVGTLTSGSIAPGFGPIDIGTSALAASQATLVGAQPLVLEGATQDGTAVTLQLQSDPSVSSTIVLPVQTGTLAVSVSDPLVLDAGGKVGLTLDPAADNILTVSGGQLTVDTTVITAVGALDSGSISPGFGNIDIGTSSLTASVGTFDALQFPDPATTVCSPFKTSPTSARRCAVDLSTVTLKRISVSANYDTTPLTKTNPSALPELNPTCGESGYGQIVTIVLMTTETDQFPVRITSCYEDGSSFCMQFTSTAATYVCLNNNALYKLT